MKNEFMYRIQILEEHLDTFGHVSNAKNLELFEQARWEIIHDKGYGVDDIKRKGVGPVVLEMNIKHVGEVGCREIITITTTAKSWEGKIGIFRQVMFKQNGQVASEVDLVLGFFDIKEEGLVVPPKDWLEVIGIEQ